MLEQRGMKTDTPSLRDAARSNTDIGVRWMAAEILGLRGDQLSRPALRHVMKGDAERLVRETAALALARLGDEEGLTLLKDFMRTAEPQRRSFLAGRLADLGEPEGYRFVAEAIAGENAQLKLLSIASLVPFVPFQGRQAVIPIDPIGRLLALLRDSDHTIRHEALINVPIALAKGAPLAMFWSTVDAMAKSDAEPGIRETARLTLLYWDEQSRRETEKQ